MCRVKRWLRGNAPLQWPLRTVGKKEDGRHRCGLSSYTQGTLSRAAGGHEICVWDLEVTECRPFPWYTSSEKVCCHRPLPSTWVKKIRKSYLNSVLSLPSSGPTCFLTSGSQGQSPAHEFGWQLHPAHLHGPGPLLGLTGLPRSPLLSLCHFLKTRSGLIVFLYSLSREGDLWNRKVGRAS